MVKKWGIQIPELTGDESRGVYVYLPDTYYKEPDRRYDVLYMFDGHNLFFDSHATYGKSWGMKEYMDHFGPQLIIAAVECNHSPDNGRLKEYSPFTFEAEPFGKIEGKGKITMDWLVNTFKKEIDRRYRTIPDRDHTFIAGSSMGGLMSLYALMDYNSYFSRAAALSPSIWVSPDELLDMVRYADLEHDTILYLDYGEKELSYREGILFEFADLISLLLQKGVLLESRIVPGGTHCEASWEQQIPFFMDVLKYNSDL